MTKGCARCAALQELIDGKESLLMAYRLNDPGRVHKAIDKIEKAKRLSDTQYDELLRERERLAGIFDCVADNVMGGMDLEDALRELARQVDPSPRYPDQKKLKIRIKRIGDHHLPLPERKSAGAAVFDLRAGWPSNVTCMYLFPGETVDIGCGFAFQIPDGYVGWVVGRSGLALNNNIYVHQGTIDSDYRGQACAIVCNLSDEPFLIRHGDRIAKMVIQPASTPEMVEVDELSETVRGSNGFGSSGR